MANADGSGSGGSSVYITGARMARCTREVSGYMRAREAPNVMAHIRSDDIGHSFRSTHTYESMQFSDLETMTTDTAPTNNGSSNTNYTNNSSSSSNSNYNNNNTNTNSSRSNKGRLALLIGGLVVFLFGGGAVGTMALLGFFKASCGDLPTISHGTVRSNNEPRSAAIYVSCYTGYKLEGNSIVICGKDGHWSELPECTIVDCGAPSLQPNSKSSPKEGTKYNSKIRITCNKGYTISGNSTIVCLRDGSWSQSPSCVPVDCGIYVPSVDLRIADRSSQSGTTFNTTLYLVCKDRYKPGDNQQMSVTCDESGVWSPTSNLICIYIPDCGSSPYVQNGVVTPTADFFTVTCDTGHYIHGNGTIVCQNNDSWSPSPTCLPVDCGLPENPGNGQVTLTSNNTTYQAEASVECNRGYLVSAEVSVSCQANRSWTGIPSCDPVDCGMPTLHANSAIVSMNDTRYNSEVLLECGTGYVMTGKASITCLANGSWSEGPLCLPVDCGLYSIPPHVRVVNTSGTTLNSVIHWDCDPGYYPSSGRFLPVVCDDTGRWSADVNPDCSSEGSVMFHATTYTLNAGNIAYIACRASNVTDWNEIIICRGNCVSTNDVVAGITRTPRKYEGKAKQSLSTVYEDGVNLVAMFNPVKCTDINMAAGSSVYTCAVKDLLDNQQTATATIVVQRKPQTPQLWLSIDIIENQIPWDDFPTKCVAVMGYPKGSMEMQTDLNGFYQPLENNGDNENGTRPVTFTSDEAECDDVATLNYYTTYSSRWNSKHIRCVVTQHGVAGNGDDELFVERRVDVIPQSVCAGQAVNTKVEHPHACFAWLTCASQRIIPWKPCEEHQCYHWTQRQCVDCNTLSKCSSGYG